MIRMTLVPNSWPCRFFFAIQNATVLVNGYLFVLHGQEFVGSYEWYDELLHDCDGGSNNCKYVTRNLSKQRPRFPYL